MAKLPTTIQKRITANTRIPQFADPLTETFIRDNIGEVIIQGMNVLLDGNTSKLEVNFLLEEFWAPM